MATTHFSGPLALGADSLTSLTAAVTLTAKDNGKHYLLDGGTGFGITLPPVANGLYFKFTVTAVFDTTAYVFTADPSGSFEGCIIEAGAVQDVNAMDTITLEHNAENIGDWIEFWSNGSDWFTFGNFLNSTSVTPAN